MEIVQIMQDRVDYLESFRVFFPIGVIHGNFPPNRELN